MRFGLNLLLWCDTLEESTLPVLEEIKAIGYDAVEIPIFETDVAKYAAWGKRLDSLGLDRTGVTIRLQGNNPISPDAAERRAGVDGTKLALDCAAAAGCEALVGPFHSALGHFTGAGPTKDEWKWGVESMCQVAEHAGMVGVTLGIEYLNRFECYFLNTAADGARFCRDVNHPRCKMMYDTFHANIEEKNTAAAIRSLKDCLAHVHISENDRSTPGAGNIRWAENFDTLHEIGYNDLMVIEAFGLALDKIVAAPKIWRRMYESEMQLARDGLKFMKQEVAKRWK
jgi:D-psicose/D-tagatose/L-ribulose 3-epimerase